MIDLVTGKCIERFPAYEIPRERETLMISRSINAEGWTAEELLADVASKFEHLESQVEQLKEIKVILAKTEEALRK